MKTTAYVLGTLFILIAGIGAALWSRPQALMNASDVRLRNETGLPVSAVRINGVYYGDLDVGATTPYKKYVAYGCSDYQLRIDGVQLESSPMLGVKALGPGEFTCVLSSSPIDDSSEAHSRRHVQLSLEGK